MRLMYFLFVFMTFTPMASAAEEAETPSPKQGHGESVQRVKWLDDLGLDDNQKAKLREIWKSKRGAVTTLREQVQAEREQLRKLMSGDAPASEVTASYRKIRQIQSELNEIDLQSMLAVREMLTPAQRIKFVGHMSMRGRLGEESPAPK